MKNSEQMLRKTAFVSVHGGHSGQFCNHAEDKLEAVVLSYIEKGFVWAGITEHMPPSEDRFMYPDEAAAGLDAKKMLVRFADYMALCRELQEKYRSEITLYIGFEAEAYSGAYAFVRELRERFAPDYIVGSVHHVEDMPIDMRADQYAEAAEAVGGIDALYARYFDLQFEMICALRPEVVGHFDVIRMFDPDYKARLEKPEIRKRIRRNLEKIRELGLILDFNVRALVKGAGEPYVSRSVLELALELGIAVVPGDDSHGVETAGLFVREGIDILEGMGFDTEWARPQRNTPCREKEKGR